MIGAMTAKRIPVGQGCSYDGIVFDRMRADGRFRIIAYQAFNAFGLIGPENNGIAILDQREYRVVCDQIERIETGYFGLAQHQIDRALALVAMSPAAFRAFVNADPRTRDQI